MTEIKNVLCPVCGGRRSDIQYDPAKSYERCSCPQSPPLQPDPQPQNTSWITLDEKRVRQIVQEELKEWEQSLVNHLRTQTTTRNSTGW